MTRKKSLLICGVGINDLPDPVSRYEKIDGVNKRIWVCPYYRTWNDMLRRVYGKVAPIKNPSYAGCSVHEDWLRLSNFKSWMETQNWEGKHLDKDILFVGNRVYSPETCVFVTRQTNNFVLENEGLRGDFRIGVSLHKQSGRLSATCRNPITKKSEHLGLFNNEELAHKTWKKRKHELACQLADLQTDERVAAALRVRYL